MKLTPDEKRILKERLKSIIENETEMLKHEHEHEAYSHGDWLRFKDEIKNLKLIVKKLGRKK